MKKKVPLTYYDADGEKFIVGEALVDDADPYGEIEAHITDHRLKEFLEFEPLSFSIAKHVKGK